MKTATQLLTQIRLISRNVANQDGTYSITDDEVLQYVNDAQDRLQNLLSATKNIAKIFCTDQIISVVANQEAYTISDRVLLNKQIEYVEFSATGLVGDYIRLEKLNLFNRDTNTTTYPHGYFKRGNQLLLQPTPSTAQGSLRISYERELDDLDVTRGRVNGAPVAKVIDLTHTTGAPTLADEALFINGNYICISDSAGNVMLRNGLIDSYAAGTDALTLVADVLTYCVGSYVLANLADGFMTLGRYTTNISKLPDACERYLVHYAVAEIFKKDSSQDYDRQAGLVATMEEDILDAMSAQTGEIQFTPQLQRYEWW
jgi:hypothetical protein